MAYNSLAMNGEHHEVQRIVPGRGAVGEHSPAVERAVLDRLRAKGRLTFAEFMDVVLYLPEAGYYAGAEPLPARDYRTSPAVHPLFGALIARQMEQMWRVLGSPRRFIAVEAGAGDGRLCRDVLDFAGHLAPAFATALRYVIVEPGAAARRQDTVLPARLADRVSRVGGSALALPLADVVGCVLSNELVDAFPVHRVVRQGGVLYESYVVQREGTLTEMLGEPSTPEIEAYFARLGLWPPEGCLVEVNLCAARFVREAARALRRGFVLTVDYGFPAEELYSPRRPAGTLRCYYRHQVNDNPYQALGRQDITTHVDFSTLIVAGREAGLRLSGLAAQRDFLLNLGFEVFANGLEEADLSPGQRYDNKYAMQELASRAGLGAFQVLIQHKGLHDPELDGFNPCNDGKRALLATGRRPPLPLL